MDSNMSTPSSSYNHIDEEDEEQKQFSSSEDEQTPTSNSSNSKNYHQHWTIDEDYILLTNQQILGNCWADIAKLLPGRSRLDVKTRFRSISRAYKRIWKPIEDRMVIESHDSKRRNWIERASKLTNRSKSAVKARYKELIEKQDQINSLSSTVPIGSPEQIFLQKKYQDSQLISSFSLNSIEPSQHLPTTAGATTTAANIAAKPTAAKVEVDPLMKPIAVPVNTASKSIINTNNNQTSQIRKKKRSRTKSIQSDSDDESNEDRYPSKSIFKCSSPLLSSFVFPSMNISGGINNNNYNYLNNNMNSSDRKMDITAESNENWNLMPLKTPDEGPLIPASILSPSLLRCTDISDPIFYCQDIFFDENDIASFIYD